MRVGDEQVFDPVFFAFGRSGLLAASATTLRTVFGQGLRLDVAGVGQGNHHVLRRDQVFNINVGRVHLDGRAARVAEFGFDRGQFGFDDRGHAFRTAENVDQVGNVRHDVFVFLHDFVLFQTGQALQAHLQDFLCLNLRQTVQAVFLQANVRQQTVRTVQLASAVGAREHFAYQRRIPSFRHQVGFRLRWRRCGFDDFDEFINIRQCDRQPL